MTLKKTHQQIADETGIARPHVTREIKRIREVSFVPGNTQRVLDALGMRIVITNKEAGDV